jgi:N-acyl-L-homoserine lactone synthetase
VNRKTFGVQRVETQDELNAVGAFRYRCYLSEGLIAPQEGACFLDEYDDLKTSLVFRVRSQDAIVGTIRLHILNKDHCKSATMTAFSDVLMPMIDAGMTLIDGARFAVEPDLGALRLSIARQTLRLYADVGELYAVDYGVAAVTCDRVEFYRRLYRFDQLCEPRSYGGLNKKLVLMGVDLRTH